MANLEIAKLFYELADILELKNIEWKPRAYRKAAQVLESLSEDVSEIYIEKGIKGLLEIPSIGEALAKKIIEYLETKKIKEHDIQKKSLPKGLYELMDVMGLGPRKIKLLYQKLKIKSLKDLENAIKRHKISQLEGFGEKSEDNILKSIELHKRGKGRFLLGQALPIAENIAKELKKLKDINKINIGGSLRRMQETIGDIDLIVIGPPPRIHESSPFCVYDSPTPGWSLVPGAIAPVPISQIPPEAASPISKKSVCSSRVSYPFPPPPAERSMVPAPLVMVTEASADAKVASTGSTPVEPMRSWPLVG